MIRGERSTVFPERHYRSGREQELLCIIYRWQHGCGGREQLTRKLLAQGKCESCELERKECTRECAREAGGRIAGESTEDREGVAGAARAASQTIRVFEFEDPKKRATHNSWSTGSARNRHERRQNPSRLLHTPSSSPIPSSLYRLRNVREKAKLRERILRGLN